MALARSDRLQLLEPCEHGEPDRRCCLECLQNPGGAADRPGAGVRELDTLPRRRARREGTCARCRRKIRRGDVVLELEDGLTCGIDECALPHVGWESAGSYID